MSTRKTIYYILAILFGVFIFIFGGSDDSPGAQLLGLIIFLVGVVGIVRGRKKNSTPSL